MSDFVIENGVLTAYTGECYGGGEEDRVDLVIPDGVTTIGARVFQRNSRIKSVVIPDSVAVIGAEAFDGCPDIKKIVMGAGVRQIGEYAFRRYGGFEQDLSVFAKDIASWCEIAFDNAYANPLTYADKFYIGDELAEHLVIPDTVSRIPNLAFGNCVTFKTVTIGSSVKEIGALAFSGCKRLYKVELPDNGLTIGMNAFASCLSLTTLTIPPSTAGYVDAVMNTQKTVEIINRSALDIQPNVHTESTVVHNGDSMVKQQDDFLFFTKDGQSYLLGYIGTEPHIVCPDAYNGEAYHLYQYAFVCNDVVQSIELGDGVLSIEDGAFDGCKNLQRIAIGRGVCRIGQTIFAGCNQLSFVSISEDNATYRSSGNCIIEKASNTLIVGCGSSGLAEGVTAIGEKAFYQCAALKNIALCDTVVHIGNNAFWGCENLETVTLPDGLQTIGMGAFVNCVKLQITIPDSVVSIGMFAFAPDSRVRITASSELITRLSANSKPETVFGSKSALSQGYLYAKETSASPPITAVASDIKRNFELYASLIAQEGDMVAIKRLFEICKKKKTISSDMEAVWSTVEYMPLSDDMRAFLTEKKNELIK